MKLNHYIIGVAAAALLGACSSEELVTTQKATTANSDGNVSITISLPGSEFNNPYSLLSASATRANNAVNYGTGSTSALGGITNLDMTKYDVRYKIAVYEKTGTSGVDKDDYTQVVDTRTVTRDKYEEITESFRLLPTHQYRIVCWADFTTQENPTADLHYKTEDLKSIKLLDATDGTNLNDESRDAYYKYLDVKATTDGKITDLAGNPVSEIVLKRPFAKVRLVTTDWNYGKLEMPKLLKIRYKSSIKRFNGIDAVTGNDTDGEEAAASSGQQTQVANLDNDLECSTIIDPSQKQYLGYSVVKNGETKYPGEVPHQEEGDNATTTDEEGNTTTKGTKIIKDYDYEAHSRTLTVDYLMTDESEQTTVAFDYEAYADDAGSKLIYKHSFSNDIPIKRNYITTILGNLLTVGGKFDVAINENFKNEWVYAEPWWDPTKLAPTQPVIADDGSYHVYNRNQFAWLAIADNPSEEAYPYKNAAAAFPKGVYLEADIDMNNIDWNPIFYGAGNMGKFDGQNHVLRNFNINHQMIPGKGDGDIERSWGVFGTYKGTIQNVTFENITINGLEGSENHATRMVYAGPIGLFCGNLKNVTAKHVFIRGKQETIGPNKWGETFYSTEYLGGIAGVIYANEPASTGKTYNIDDLWTNNDLWCNIENCHAEDIHIEGRYSGGLAGLVGLGNKFDNCSTDYIYILSPQMSGRFIGALGNHVWIKTNNTTTDNVWFVDSEGNVAKTSEGKDYVENDTYTDKHLWGSLVVDIKNNMPNGFANQWESALMNKAYDYFKDAKYTGDTTTGNIKYGD